MILRWAQFPEAIVASYKVYRSMVGVRAMKPTPASVAGKTLILKINGSINQTVSFSGVTDVVAQINAVIYGGLAYNSLADITKILIRSDIREAPGSVEVVGGTALADFNLTARLVTELSEDEVIATVPVGLPEVIVEYEDLDGALLDWYAITTIDAMSNESRKTAYMQPITCSGKVCILEGIVLNLQGVRVPDAEVVANIVIHPQGDATSMNVTLEPVKTLSGTDGRYSLIVLQNALIKLEIPAVGFSHHIRVPETAYAFVNELQVDLDYRYPLGYNGVN